jgi:hypothetical protein
VSVRNSRVNGTLGVRSARRPVDVCAEMGERISSLRVVAGIPLVAKGFSHDAVVDTTSTS